MIICPNCGQQNETGVAKCIACGQDLAPRENRIRPISQRGSEGASNETARPRPIPSKANEGVPDSTFNPFEDNSTKSAFRPAFTQGPNSQNEIPELRSNGWEEEEIPLPQSARGWQSMNQERSVPTQRLTNTISNTSSYSAFNTTKPLPFLGQNGALQIDAGAALGVSINNNEFEVQFQQKSQIEIGIDDTIVENNNLSSLLTIKLPGFVDLNSQQQDIFQMQTTPLSPSTRNIENYPINHYSTQSNINFGYLVLQGTDLDIPGQVNSNVLPLVSNDPVDQYFLKPQNYLSNSIALDFGKIKNQVQQNPLIQHELYRLEEQYRWDYPLSIKAEVESPLITLLKTVGIYDPNVLKQLKAIGIERWDQDLPEDIQDIVYSKLWGGKAKDFLGLYPSIVSNTLLGTIRIILTNTTDHQAFPSALNNTEVRFNFPKQYFDLYQPSNLKVIAPTYVQSYYNNETGVLIWDPIKVAPGESVIFEFQCAWDVINDLNALNLEIRGEYENSPSFLDRYYYVTPMGFPVHIPTQTWNPGAIDPQMNVFIPGVVDSSGKFTLAEESVAQKVTNNATFFEKVSLNISRAMANIQASSDVLEKSYSFVKYLREFSDTVGITQPFENPKEDN